MKTNISRQASYERPDERVEAILLKLKSGNDEKEKRDALIELEQLAPSNYQLLLKPEFKIIKACTMLILNDADEVKAQALFLFSKLCQLSRDMTAVKALNKVISSSTLIPLFHSNNPYALVTILLVLCEIEGRLRSLCLISSKCSCSRLHRHQLYSAHSA